MSPPEIARGPGTPHSETAKAADETASKECTVQIVDASPRRRIVQPPDAWFGRRSGATRRRWRKGVQ